jgi:1,4-dihydroxy-2-naphthoate octaprenyltransferase
MLKNSRSMHEQQIPSLVKMWVMASRPKTLSLSCVPIFVGTILAMGKAAHINWIMAIAALVCAFFIQIGINLINDAWDFKRGADTEERIGPQRVTQSGFLTYNQVLNAGVACFAFALLIGTPLVITSGWPLASALILSVIFGYYYTGGPFPLAYFGLGEVFVMIFFGYVITCSAYFLQTGKIDAVCLLAATQIGLLAVIPIVINNTRDIESDRKAHKWTLSARFGIQFSRWEIILLTGGSYLLGFFWLVLGFPMMSLMPFLALPFIYQNVGAVCKTEPSKVYNQFLARSAQGQLFFALLLCMGYGLSLYGN